MQTSRGIAVAIVVGVGCGAQVVVTKITDQNRNTAQGYRYYLSRPYVAVKKEFPYDSRDEYVQGLVTKVDGALFLNIDPAELTAHGLDKRLDHVPASDVMAARGLQGDTGGGSGSDDGGGGDGGGKGKGKGSGSGSGSGSGGGSDSGKGEASASDSGNGLVPIADGVFDIAYLPDFDEQYAINVDGKWASAELKLQMGNGWMLQNVDQKVDNSAVVSFITDQIGKTADIARSFVSAKLGLSSSGLSGYTSGTPITVHVRTLTYVVPGMYPLAKPREIAARCERGSAAANGANSLASGTTNFQSDCEELFHYHGRTERLIEVPAIPGAAAGDMVMPTDDDDRLTSEAKDAIKKASLDGKVKLVDVTASGAAIRVRIDATTAADKTKANLDAAAKAIHQQTGLENAQVNWSTDPPKAKKSK